MRKSNCPILRRMSDFPKLKRERDRLKIKNRDLAKAVEDFTPVVNAARALRKLTNRSHKIGELDRRLERLYRELRKVDGPKA